MNGRGAGGAVRPPAMRIEKDSDAVFAAAIRARVLSEDPEADNFAGRYMYMHHDAGGAAWFKHRDTRAYVTMCPADGSPADGSPADGNTPGTGNGPATEEHASAGPKRAVGPGLWATAALAGVFAAGALVAPDRGGPVVGTVRLNDLTAEFLAGTVRGADSPEETARAARLWGARLEAALDDVAGRHGVVLLPVEAVAAGANDYTEDVRTEMQRTAADRAREPGP